MSARRLAAACLVAAGVELFSTSLLHAEFKHLGGPAGRTRFEYHEDRVNPTTDPTNPELPLALELLAFS